MQFDIIIYCPLTEEFRVVCDVFKHTKDHTEKFGTLALEANIANCRLLLVAGQEMGSHAAQSALNLIQKHASFSTIICLGICGSLSEDLGLTDVCYTGHCFDITQNSKVKGDEHRISTIPYRTPVKLTNSLNYFNQHPNLQIAREFFSVAVQKRRENLERSSDNSADAVRELRSLDLTTIRTMGGAVVSGPVVSSTEMKKQLENMDRKVLAVETEVGGLFSLFESDDSVSVLTIRGVSDKSDDQKSDLEEATGGLVRSIAVGNAAEFLKANILHNSFFTDAVGAQHESDVQAHPVEIKIDSLESALSKVRSNNRARLLKKSVEYRSGDGENWVPAPRLIIENPENPDNNLHEVVDSIGSYENILISVPSDYPDKAAPELYVSSLLGETLGDLVLVPLLVNGDQLKRPKTIETCTFDLSKGEIDVLRDRTDCQLVFIIESYNFAIPNRTDWYLEEAKRLSGQDKIIAFNGIGIDAQLARRDYGSLISFAKMEKISFANIARFIGRQFALKADQAETFALRLSNTFDQFNVPAHPSYFADIPFEFLQKLIEANRRSELIEFAVLGLLTIIVSEDNSFVRPSRTVRLNFLERLMIETQVEKRINSVSQLNEFTEEYLKLGDFDLSPTDFLRSFEENGVISIRNDQFDFPMEFVRSYILAKALASDAEAARKYFDLSDVDVDLSTLSLICEMGAGGQFLKEIKCSLKNCSNKFDEILKITSEDREGRKMHSLLDGNIGPTVLKNQDAISRIRAKLKESGDQILCSDGDADNKQVLLDIKSKGRRIAANRVSGRSENRHNEDGADHVLHSLKVARSFIGAASEHLDANDKTELVNDYISVVSLVLDDWYRDLASWNVLETKEAFITDLLEDHDLEQLRITEEQLRKFASLFIDMLELKLYSEVLPSLMMGVHETMGQPIFAKALVGYKAGDKVQEAIASLWMLSTRHKGGLYRFKQAVKKIPKRAFPRVTLANYLLARAYWNAVDDDEKIELLASAEECLVPISLQLSSNS